MLLLPTEKFKNKNHSRSSCIPWLIEGDIEVKQEEVSRSRRALPLAATLAVVNKVLIIARQWLSHTAGIHFHVCVQENTIKHSCISNAHLYLHYLGWLWPMAAAVVLGVWCWLSPRCLLWLTPVILCV